MRICIVGGGVGGLALAARLDANRHEIIVLEKDSALLFAQKYAWYDNLNTQEMERGGWGFLVPKSFPPEGTRRLASATKREEIAFRIGASGIYEPVYRPALLNRLKEAAAQNATLRYGVPVRVLRREGKRVTGVTTESGEALAADLVVDCAGLMGLGRSLAAQPALTLRPSDIFVAYRAVFRGEGAAKAPFMDNIVLKHLGETGVGWLNVDPDGHFDVLIGRVGSLRKETIAASLADLKAWCADWAVLGQEMHAGVYKIPVRYPLLQMVYDGYAALGDAASMTIPMMGSGIVNTLRAAKILAGLLNQGCENHVEDLWAYQAAYYKETKDDIFWVDAMKRVALGLPNEDLSRLLGSALLSGADVARIFTGRRMDMRPAALGGKLARGRKNLALLTELGFAAGKGMALDALARRIPQHYDPDLVGLWRRGILELVSGI
jgi:flavin-dependent dehydrogenase